MTWRSRGPCHCLFTSVPHGTNQDWKDALKNLPISRWGSPSMAHPDGTAGTWKCTVCHLLCCSRTAVFLQNCLLMSQANRQKPSITKREVSCSRYSQQGEKFGQASWEDDPPAQQVTDLEDLSFVRVLCRSQVGRRDHTCRKQ